MIRVLRAAITGREAVIADGPSNLRAAALFTFRISGAHGHSDSSKQSGWAVAEAAVMLISV
jgi:hypothetical protein